MRSFHIYFERGKVNDNRYDFFDVRKFSTTVTAMNKEEAVKIFLENERVLWREKRGGYFTHVIEGEKITFYPIEINEFLRYAPGYKDGWTEILSISEQNIVC